MKILLVRPDIPPTAMGYARVAFLEPLALEILAASVPDHSVRILDLRLGAGPSLDEVLGEFAPDLVGATGYTTDVPRMWDICRQVKAHDRRIFTVVGGYHASLCPHDFDRDDVDAIVVGEGEVTFPQLVEAVANGRDVAAVAGLVVRRDGQQVRTAPRPLLPDLDASPFPARHLVADHRRDLRFHLWSAPYAVETVRGCSYRCTFCAVWRFHHEARFKSPPRVLAEVREATGDLVFFVDDNFLLNLDRAERICELIEAEGLQTRFFIQARADGIVRRPELIEKWASIGLSTVFVGFEKFRQEELAELDKRATVAANEEAARILKANGIHVIGAFIVDPTWDVPDFEAMIEHVRRLGVDFPQFTVLTPLPGTVLYDERRAEMTTHDYALFDLMHSLLPTRLPLPQFYEQMARLYRETITMSLSELKALVRAGRIPLHQRLSGGKEYHVANPQAYLRGHDHGE